MNKPSKKKRAPGRPLGTVRKEKTVVMRIPLSKVEAVKEILKEA